MPRIVDRRAEQLAFADDVVGADDPRQQRAVDAEEREQLVVPVERLERREHRARRVRHVGDVHRRRRSASRRATLSTVPNASPSRRVLAQEPLELRRREVRIGDEPGLRADQLGVELAAALGGAPVLPHDRGRDRRSRRAVPEQRRLALVRDRDRRQVGRLDARRLSASAAGRGRSARSPPGRARPSPGRGKCCGSSR